MYPIEALPIFRPFMPDHESYGEPMGPPKLTVQEVDAIRADPSFAVPALMEAASGHPDKSTRRIRLRSGSTFTRHAWQVLGWVSVRTKRSCRLSFAGWEALHRGFILNVLEGIDSARVRQGRTWGRYDMSQCPSLGYDLRDAGLVLKRRNKPDEYQLTDEGWWLVHRLRSFSDEPLSKPIVSSGDSVCISPKAGYVSPSSQRGPTNRLPEKAHHDAQQQPPFDRDPDPSPPDEPGSPPLEEY